MFRVRGSPRGEHMFVKQNVPNDLTSVLEPVIIDVVGGRNRAT